MDALDFLKQSSVFAIFAVVYFSAHRLWRRQAISCAARWVEKQGLSVADWTTAIFQMHRTAPCMSFVAATADGQRMDVKLRLGNTFFGGYEVREIACCRPQDVTEDDPQPLFQP